MRKATPFSIALVVMVSHITLLPQPVAAQSLADMERQIITDTNKFRLSQGRQQLRPNAILGRTAKAFACWMARTGNYGHLADGREPSQRAQAQGFPKNGCVGENIAWNNYPRAGQAQRLTNGWINSPPHRKNMLTLGAKITGVGICQQGRKFYGVQLIGRLTRASIKIINKTPFPVQYRYGSQSDRPSQQHHRRVPQQGVLQGHPNGWRSLTLSLCEYTQLTATQMRPQVSGRSRSVSTQSMMVNDSQQIMVFE